MASRAIVYVGAKCDGSCGNPPRVCDTGSDKALLGGKRIHRLGDHWITHSGGAGTHDGVLTTASTRFIVQGKGAGRVGDSISCTSKAAEGYLKATSR